MHKSAFAIVGDAGVARADCPVRLITSPALKGNDTLPDIKLLSNGGKPATVPKPAAGTLE